MNTVHEELVVNNLKLVHYIIHRYFKYDTEEYEDLYQIGCMGLCKASKAFDSAQGAFSTFAVYVIRQQILMTKRKKRLVTSSLDAEIDDGVTLQDVIADSKSVDDYLIFYKDDMKKALLSMDERGQAICKDYISGFNQDKIAKKHGISQSYVSRIIKKFRNNLEIRVKAK